MAQKLGLHELGFALYYTQDSDYQVEEEGYMKKRWTRRFIFIALAVIAICGLSACGRDRGIRFDVLENLDMSSVVQNGEYTNFSAVTESGKVVRFQGKGITVSDHGISMMPGAFLVSLDYIGEIDSYILSTEENKSTFFYGVAYADASGVQHMKELQIAFAWKEVFEQRLSANISNQQSGFFAIRAGLENIEERHVTQLEIYYDDSVPQVLYQDLDPAGQIAELLSLYPTDWDAKGETADTYDALQAKLEEPGVIQSDILAGIDYDSVVVDGESTFFSSVLSDGTVVRFEGYNIGMDERGITMYQDSKVTSLDAVGKIYGYSAYIENGEAYGESAYLDFGYGYTYSAAKTSVARASDVHTYAISGEKPSIWNKGIWGSTMVHEPNFVYFASNPYYKQEYVVTSLKIAYNPAVKVTAIVEAKLSEEFSTSYLEGERYNPELAEPADGEFGYHGFYLCLRPDTPYSNLQSSGGGIWFVPKAFFEVGDLKDAEGNVLDKASAKVMPGTTLDVVVGDYTVSVGFTVIEQYKDARTMNDLVPYAFPDALGTNNVLVVPIAWADQKENANNETLALYRKNLGRVTDEYGTVTDYSDETDRDFSLSEYFNMASYGKLTLNSFMTDWYYAKENFAEMELASPSREFADGILEWVKERYPDLNWAEYDQDANGYVDSLVLLNSGVSSDGRFSIISYSGAIHYRESYYGDRAGTQEDPNVNTFVTVNDQFLRVSGAETLIHEFSHNFGLIDYYDVSYSSIDAVGGFDMQSANKGDWNAYSKLSVGWMEPQVVTGLESGESVELTIGSLALTDDVILIPAKGKEYEGPFSEYIMIDLLTDDGVNRFDAVEYGLQDMAGVRISHVNAAMEKRTMEIASKITPGEMKTYDIGTIHIANEKKTDGKGRYNIEVVQAGKVNTFTEGDGTDVSLSKEDLFYEGDTFTVEDYSEFFYQGLMDDASRFGYVVQILEIGTDAEGNPIATVRVTAE